MSLFQCHSIPIQSGTVSFCFAKSTPWVNSIYSPYGLHQASSSRFIIIRNLKSLFACLFGYFLTFRDAVCCLGAFCRSRHSVPWSVIDLHRSGHLELTMDKFLYLLHSSFFTGWEGLGFCSTSIVLDKVGSNLGQRTERLVSCGRDQSGSCIRVKRWRCRLRSSWIILNIDSLMSWHSYKQYPSFYFFCALVIHKACILSSWLIGLLWKIWKPHARAFRILRSDLRKFNDLLRASSWREV